MPSVVYVLIVVMLNIIMLNVVMLKVKAPNFFPFNSPKKWSTMTELFWPGTNDIKLFLCFRNNFNLTWYLQVRKKLSTVELIQVHLLWSYSYNTPRAEVTISYKLSSFYTDYCQNIWKDVTIKLLFFITRSYTIRL